MHHWSDDWFQKHGDDLNNAISFIETNWHRFGRLSVTGCKEKFGTFRDHSYFWDGTLYSLFCGYYRVPKYWRWFYYKIDLPFMTKFFKYTGLLYLFIKYQSFIYNLIIQIACRNYPNIVDELCMDLQYPELVKPGWFGEVDGIEIHDKHWNTVGD